MEYQELIEQVFLSTQQAPALGAVASYIPELKSINDKYFGVHIRTIEDADFGMGDHLIPFSIQSISKVFSLCLAYRIVGEEIWNRLGVEPSGTAFNSLVQLETDNGIPRNPFINSGALVICDILISCLEHPKEDFLTFIHDVSGNKAIQYSARIAASEASVGYRNKALCNFIKSFGNIVNDPDEVLDFYFFMCSIEMTCAQLTDSFLFLANRGIHPKTKKEIVSKSQAKRMNAIMQSCGFYDESGEFSFKVGLPGKSGVGGGIVAIYPGNYVIAVWSPKLNQKGNSYKGMLFLEEFTTKTGFSIF